MQLRNWDIFQRATRPYVIQEPSTFITNTHITTPHELRGLYAIAEDCQQHRFLVNTDNDSAWEGVPDNVIPVFNYPNIVGHHFDKWLERCEYDGPKVVRIFCQTKYAPDLLKRCDWVILHGFTMNTLRGVLDRLLKMGVPTYVHKYRNSTQLPLELRCRNVPSAVNKHFNKHPFSRALELLCQG